MRSNPLAMARKEQWAIMYEHQRREFQQQQLIEQEKQRSRKQAFKQALDRQRHDKKNLTNDQRLQDLKYSQYLHAKGRREQEEEDRKRAQNLQRRREVEDTNYQVIESKRKRGNSEMGNVYTIGMENVEEIKRKNEINKRLLSQELKYQQYEKNQLKEQERIRDLEKDILNREFELGKEEQRLQELDRLGRYKQNMEVYDMYSRVKSDRVHEVQAFEKKLITDAARERERIEAERVRREESEKIKKTVLMKDSLLEQIETHNRLKTNKDNGVYYNNRMYDEFYKDKRPKFDKDEYLKTLSQQRQDQNIRKNTYKYMSDQELKLNAGYLEKALHGESVPMRNDRSPFAIGNQVQVSKRRDDIYFNKLGGGRIEPGERERVSRSSQSMDMNRGRESRTSREHREPNPEPGHEDLELIKLKIEKIIADREAGRRTKDAERY